MFSCNEFNNQPDLSMSVIGHAHATLFGDVGGSPNTAQALLGHSDLEGTFNTYTHAIPDSQRTAVERVAGALLGLWTQLDSTPHWRQRRADGQINRSKTG